MEVQRIDDGKCINSSSSSWFPAPYWYKTCFLFSRFQQWQAGQSGTHFAIFRFSPPREPEKYTCCGPPPTPRQGPLALPCERATGGLAMCCLLSLSAGHARVCCFLFCGAQLYKIMRLQVVPVYSPDLRKRPFHAGLRGVLMKRLAAF